MKKLLFTSVLLLAFACSKDDEQKDVDPIVGSWLSSNSDGLSIDTADDGKVLISYLVVYNSNGTFGATTEYSTPPNVSDNGTWENLGSDLTSIYQIYLMTSDGNQQQVTFTFTEDFNEYRVSGLTYTKQ